MDRIAEPAPSAADKGRADPSPSRRVLNAGCGVSAPDRLHSAFRDPAWIEVRFDIDARVQPDIVGSITNLTEIADASFDAIWCSHNLEHLHTHEVPKALKEFRRVLKQDGFALITTPDIETIAELIASGRLEDVAYESPAGPVTALDMIYGLSTSIAAGHTFMAHHTAFNPDRLGRLLIDSGFTEALVIKGQCYDVWALGLMPDISKQDLLVHLRTNKLDFFSDG